MRMRKAEGLLKKLYENLVRYKLLRSVCVCVCEHKLYKYNMCVILIFPMQRNNNQTRKLLTTTSELFTLAPCVSY